MNLLSPGIAITRQVIPEIGLPYISRKNNNTQLSRLPNNFTNCHRQRSEELQFASGAQEMLSVEPHQKHRTLFRFRFVRQSSGALAVVVEHSDAHPPVSHRADKLQDFGRLVSLLHVFR